MNSLLVSSLISANLHGVPVALPDPLTLSSGERVETAQMWREQRRRELLELFRRHVYGRAPLEKPADLRFEVETTPGAMDGAMDGAATLKQVTIRFSGTNRDGETPKQGVIRLTLFVPMKAKPAPCFVLINHRNASNTDSTRALQSDFWPAELLIARGYAAATFHVSDLDPDVHDNFQDGVHGLFDPPVPATGERAGDAWGTIGAWAWGASRVMDYLQTDSDIDASRVAVVGHSRGGKTALWAGAQDERFALVISNDSGSTGAALSRGKKGETVKVINRNFPHWFSANYKRFGDREAELPIDQHQLLALVAPRLLYIASASEDEWADPAAEYASAVAATPVYELFGFKGLNKGLNGSLPPVETPIHQGRISHHVRKGAHNMTRYDWEQFLAFADQHLKS